MSIIDALAIYAAHHNDEHWLEWNRELWTTVLSIISTHAKTTLAKLSAERIEIEPAPPVDISDDTLAEGDAVILRSVPEPKTPFMLTIQRNWIGKKGTITGLPRAGFEPPLYKCKMHGGPEFFALRDMLTKVWPS